MDLSPLPPEPLKQEHTMDMDTSTVRQIYEDGWVELNGRRYEFLRMTHLERRKVLAYAPMITDMSFLEDPKWNNVEKLIWSRISYDGRIISQDPEHWENHMSDYVQLLQIAVSVIVYPFLPESGTTSRAADLQPAATTPSRKPM